MGWEGLGRHIREIVADGAAAVGRDDLRAAEAAPTAHGPCRALRSQSRMQNRFSAADESGRAGQPRRGGSAVTRLHRARSAAS